MKHQIKHRYTGAVLFEANLPNDTPSSLVVRRALEQATKARADLAGADLAGTDLSGAYLSGADLAGADLSGAHLSGADLADANLVRAYLSGAYLSGANLVRAYLSGANLADGLKLIGKRPVFQVGPIGSRSDFFVAYITDQGLRFDAGCKRQITREKFEELLDETHGDNEHASEYRAALALIDVHAGLWTPTATQQADKAPEVEAA